MSLVGTLPQLVIKKIFEKSKPRKMESCGSSRRRPITRQRSTANMERFQEVDVLRLELFNDMYPLPLIFREIGWIVLLIVSVAACLTAV